MKKISSVALEQKACSFIHRDAWRAGRIFFEKFVRRNPGNALAHAYLGFFRVKDSRFDTKRGLSEFDQALRLDPKCALAHSYRAITLGALLKFERATKELKLAQKLGAKSSDIALARGCVELDAGSVKKAIAHFRRLVRLQTDSTSMILLSQAYSQAGNQQQALSWATRAFRKDPADFRALAYMGIYLSYLRRFGEARRRLERALKLNKAYALSHHAIAYLARQEGNTRDAERYLRSSLKVDPVYVTSRKMLADLCAGSGRTEEAKRHYQLALKHYPEYKEAREALNRLPTPR